MAISINKIQNIKRPISITIDGEDLNCVYRLSGLSADLSYWLRDHANDEGSLFEMCEKLLVSWDLVDGEGHTITPTRAEIEKYDIPTPVILAIFAKIGEDSQAKSLARRTSAKETTKE